MTTEDYNKYYIQGSDHYLIPRDELKILLRENQELKKQLKNSIKVNMADHKYASECEDKVVTLEAHQKEFIKYLQEELNVQIQEESIGCETTNKRHILQEILQKYKLIIGDDKNGTN